MFKLILVIHDWDTSYDIALRWVSLYLTDDKSTLVQVMAGAIRQQAITWTNVDPDLCRHKASLGHNELTVLQQDCTEQWTVTQVSATLWTPYFGERCATFQVTPHVSTMRGDLKHYGPFANSVCDLQLCSGSWQLCWPVHQSKWHHSQAHINNSQGHTWTPRPIHSMTPCHKIHSPDNSVIRHPPGTSCDAFSLLKLDGQVHERKLRHSGLGNMVSILQTTFLNALGQMEISYSHSTFIAVCSLELIWQSSTVQVNVWHWTGEKPLLPEWPVHHT